MAPLATPSYDRVGRRCPFVDASSWRRLKAEQAAPYAGAWRVLPLSPKCCAISGVTETVASPRLAGQTPDVGEISTCSCQRILQVLLSPRAVRS